MKCNSAFNQVVQVTKVRPNGDATVDVINDDGSIMPRRHNVVVVFPSHTKGLVNIGSVWRVTGVGHKQEYKINDFNITEMLINCTSANFLKPSGQVLARWISSNIGGIGSVIANRLVRQENLTDFIEKNDRKSLLEVSGMTNDRVDALISLWPTQSLYDTITWVEEQNLPFGIGSKLVKLFGDGAIERIKSQPFVLTSMGVPFQKVADVAIKLGFDVDDDEFLLGVAQHVTSKYENKTGSTIITSDELQSLSVEAISKGLQRPVGEIACDNGFLVRVTSGYQIYGTALMEAAVANFLVDTLYRPKSARSLVAGWEQTLTQKNVVEAFNNAQTRLPFKLTEEQKEAVIEAVLAPVCCLSGGAGTGKTVILRVLIDMYELLNEGLPIYQVALAGRAAQRMAEATGRPAQTIAGFVNNYLGEHKPDLPEHLLLIIDEASMVDLLSMYRLVSVLPDATRILFVGDVAQLPPVGKGLIFHSMMGGDIPFFELKKVRRQQADSEILKFATNVRNGVFKLPSPTQSTIAKSKDCSLEENIDITKLIALWSEAGGIENSIVLSPVKNGDAGVNNINKRLQTHIGLSRKALSYSDDSKGLIPWITSNGTRLLLGDPVLVTKNMYEKDINIRNGDLGIITKVFDDNSKKGVLGIMSIDGRLVDITYDVVSCLQLGYAITIHKSQGSQWETCFIMLPKEAIRMTDQSLLYTASTRPTKTLVLIGERSVIENAIKLGAAANKRRTFLAERLALVTEVMRKTDLQST